MEKPPGKKHRGVGRVAFLARIETIQAEIEQGWPLTAIYERHQGALGITYSQFARYVRHYLRNEEEHEKPKSPQKKASAAAGSTGQGDSPQAPPGPGQPQFRFDPKWANRDKLV